MVCLKSSFFSPPPAARLSILSGRAFKMRVVLADQQRFLAIGKSHPKCILRAWNENSTGTLYYNNKQEAEPAHC